jgi:endonuclease YncB( thermonuclease family)
MAKVPNTITDKQYADLQQRARKAAPPMFSKKAVQGRLASKAQQKKAGQS